MQSLSNLEELILPPGDLGVTFKMGVNGMCTVVDKSSSSSPLQILDVIISLNGIKLVDVKDGEPAWVKLFDAFKSAPMNLVVCRGGEMEQQRQQQQQQPPVAPEMEPMLPPINQALVPDFEVCTEVKKREKDKALLCKAVGCEKLLQSSHGGFCRGHYKRYLISTGQCESWQCKCGEKISASSIRCGKCHRWRYGQKPGTRKTLVPEDADIQISEIVLRNERGRPLCKVINCGKTEQAHNDGFCRTHFNQFVMDDPDYEANGMKNPWTCVCGKQWPEMQKRCGNNECQKWRNGKRLLTTTTTGTAAGAPKKRKKKVVEEDLGNAWTCDKCQTVVAERKTRCGKCHRWRGGKRQGGWKLGTKAAAEEDFDRTTEWTCCDQPLPASQTRCGKCNKWRGGKRRAAKPLPEIEAKKVKIPEVPMMEHPAIEPAAVVGVNETNVPLIPEGVAVGMHETVNEVVVGVASEMI